MKRLILLILTAATVVMLTAYTPTTRTTRQTQAHQIAELARALGEPEDSPIIKRASEIWWAAENEPTLTYAGVYQITGYDPYCSHCCGKSNGITASGVQAVIGETVAAQTLPLGTRLYIEGLGYYTVHDRSGGDVIDIACSGHEACYAITGRRNVYIVEG